MRNEPAVRKGYKWQQATFSSMGDNIDDDVLEIHWFPLEENPLRSSYPAMVSLNWFQSRDTPLHLSVYIEPLRRALHMIALRDGVDAYVDEPHFFHKSLWDFYASIGYDHKKKKWGDRPQNITALTNAQLRARCLELDVDYANYSEIPVRA